MIGALVVAALVGIVSAISGHFGTVSGQAFFTVALFVVYALLSWYDADVSAKRATWFGALSLGVTIYLLVIGIVKIWFPLVAHHDSYGFFGDYVSPSQPDFVGEFGAWFWLAIIARVALLHIHLLLFIYRKYAAGTMRRISQVTFYLVGLLAITLSIPTIFRGVHFAGIYWRAIAVIAILDALGTVLVPLIYSLFHRQRNEAAAGPELASQFAVVSYERSPIAAAGYAAPTPAPVAPAPADSGNLPPSNAYAEWVPEQTQLKLKWPQYEDGRPLPRNSDGTPDFTGVVGY
jgi:hypothetical protein